VIRILIGGVFLKRRFAYILFILLLLFVVGCSSDAEKAMEKFISSKEGKFTIVTFFNKNLTGDFQEKIGEVATAHQEEIEAVFYISLENDSSQEYDYKDIFHIKEQPQIIVFDYKGVVLQTNELEELAKYFK
jgi:hypothetical protein